MRRLSHRHQRLTASVREAVPRSSATLPLLAACVAPGQLRLPENMLLDRRLHLTSCRPPLQTKRAQIERVEGEDVTMARIVRRRAGTVVVGVLKIVAARHTNGRLPLGQLAH